MSARAAVPGRGFSLLEVMIGLALLGLGLVVLIKSTTGNIRAAKRAQMMGVVTDLSRGKMYDIEEKLLKDGFTETDQSEDGETFDEEGWPEIKYSYKVEQVELPSFDQLQALAKDAGSAAGSAARGSGAGSGAGEDGEPSGRFEDSALGGVISMIGGGFGTGSTDIDAAQGASFIQGYYQIIQEALKASIRKVTLTVQFDVLGEENELTTVAFFTDAAGMDQGILGGLDALGGAGAGSGGTGGTPTPPTTPTPGGPRR
jgi:prepilin-type N-terminal cleavage/methylation domain-containing protein